MVKGKKLIRLALFGQPVKASLSPAIHRAFADQLGLEIEYRLIETGPDEFPDQLQAFRQKGGVGCNITLPLKQLAWQLAEDETAEVRLAQAANTLISQPASGWFAHNTDGAGLVADLRDNNDVPIEAQRILVLGAGGAAAGILGSLLAQKPAEVVLVNRNLERAGTLAKRFSSLGKIAVTGWEELPEQGCFNLVINATSLGHHGEAPPLKPALFSRDSCCYDLNYYKASQPLRSLCEDLRQNYTDGLGMLVEQAAHSFSIWTGKRPGSRPVIDRFRSMEAIPEPLS
jgi:shikimate dehydrogenase